MKFARGEFYKSSLGPIAEILAADNLGTGQQVIAYRYVAEFDNTSFDTSDVYIRTADQAHSWYRVEKRTITRTVTEDVWEVV